MIAEVDFATSTARLAVYTCLTCRSQQRSKFNQPFLHTPSPREVLVLSASFGELNVFSRIALIPTVSILKGLTAVMPFRSGIERTSMRRLTGVADTRAFILVGVSYELPFSELF